MTKKKKKKTRSDRMLGTILYSDVGKQVIEEMFTPHQKFPVNCVRYGAGNSI